MSCGQGDTAGRVSDTMPSTVNVVSVKCVGRPVPSRVTFGTRLNETCALLTSARPTGFWLGKLNVLTLVLPRAASARLSGKAWRGVGHCDRGGLLVQPEGVGDVDVGDVYLGRIEVFDDAAAPGEDRAARTATPAMARVKEQKFIRVPPKGESVGQVRKSWVEARKNVE